MYGCVSNQYSVRRWSARFSVWATKVWGRNGHLWAYDASIRPPTDLVHSVIGVCFISVQQQKAFVISADVVSGRFVDWQRLRNEVIRWYFMVGIVRILDDVCKPVFIPEYYLYVTTLLEIFTVLYVFEDPCLVL